MMVLIPTKDMSKHTNSSITAMPISSDMMTVAASLARLVTVGCHHLGSLFVRGMEGGVMERH